MAVYLIDKPYSDLAVDMVNKDERGTVILIQDGVYLDVTKFTGKKEIYCIDKDADKRNIKKLHESITRITYDEVVDLMAIEEVFTFI